MTTSSMPPPAVCDRARQSRDARFDGLFFTAVRSTGIYCRPVCPAPAPKPRNIAYFPTAASAAAAGYRPCLRCRPELSPGARRPGEATVDRALAMIEDGALDNGSIEALAERVGLGSRQLRRLFLARTGVTPLAVQATRRLLLAKQLLTETTLPVTEIALAAGFGSLRRFNTAFREGCGMPPTAIRRTRAEAPAATLTLRLGYRPPLDFPALLAFLARRAVPAVERVDLVIGAYERRIATAAGPRWVRVTADRTRPELRLEIAGVDPRSIPGLVRRVRRLFDLDADMAAVHAALRADKRLARGLARRPGLRVPGGWDGFETAVRAVLGQQVTVAAATTLATRLVHACNGELTPDRVQAAPLDRLGLTRARAATLRALAGAVRTGDVDFTAGQPLDAFVTALTALPGIGPWTAHYVAMRALGHPDAFPAGDLVVQQVLGGGGRRVTEREAEARSQAWRPWRAYAVLHLWHLSGDIRRKESA